MVGDDPFDPVAMAVILKRQELFVAAARTLLAHRDAGRVCDAESVKWAEGIVSRFADGAAGVEPRRAA